MVSRWDARSFREVLGHYPTGVALVSAVTQQGRPIGMIVGSFTSVSLDPPLVAYLPMRTSRTFEVMRRSGTFVVNVLAAEQENLCRRFAGPGEDKWHGVRWRPSPSGAPILDGAVAWIECSTDSITEAGDHYVVLGRVDHLEVQDAATPLLFFQGGYGRFATSSMVAAPARTLRPANLPRPASDTDLPAWIDTTRRTARELAVHLADHGARRDPSTHPAAGSGWG
jgi:flavin reductase (DIM6/NTAB) family NADH-FMN oxidoreductase RutF